MVNIICAFFSPAIRFSQEQKRLLRGKIPADFLPDKKEKEVPVKD